MGSFCTIAGEMTNDADRKLPDAGGMDDTAMRHAALTLTDADARTLQTATLAMGRRLRL